MFNTEEGAGKGRVNTNNGDDLHSISNLETQVNQKLEHMPPSSNVFLTKTGGETATTGTSSVTASSRETSRSQLLHVIETASRPNLCTCLMRRCRDAHKYTDQAAEMTLTLAVSNVDTGPRGQGEGRFRKPSLT